MVIFITTDFKKIVRIGRVKVGTYRRHVFLEIEFHKGKLSMHGTVGPRASGNCYGSSGQIVMEFAHRNPEDNDARTRHPIEPGEIEFAPGWSKAKWLDLIDIWESWHLNDMRPGCEHQMAEKWGQELLKFTTYILNSSTCQMRQNIERRVQQEIGLKGTASVTPEEQEVLNLPYSLDVPEGSPEPKLIWYNPKTMTSKYSGHTYPTEHPQGVLTKPCPICGHKYGSDWQKVEVPEKVLDFLRSLPDTDIEPAWV